VASGTASGFGTSGLFDAEQRASERNSRLDAIIALRALYRNFVRARFLLRLPSPVYTPAEDSDEEDTKEKELREQENRREAVEVVAEMVLTAEQLNRGLRLLRPGFGTIFEPGASAMADAAGVVNMPSTGGRTPQECEEVVREQARQYVQTLRERVAVELPQLPYPTEAATLAAIEVRNARYLRAAIGEGGSGSGSPLGSMAGSGRGVAPSPGPSPLSSLSHGGDRDKREPAEQLASGIEQAERVAEAFVATRIKPVLRKARETELVDLVRETSDYLRGLWVRLNGGGSRLREPPLDPALPLPAGARLDTELAMGQLSLELDVLEAQLREAVRARDAKIRRARAPEGRATMPFQLKALDEEVLRLSRALAVRTLQLEMEYAGRALEEEALDVVGSDVAELLSRQGSTAELRLLAAEYGYLDTQLAALAAQVGLEAQVAQAGSELGGPPALSSDEGPGQLASSTAPVSSAAAVAAAAAGRAMSPTPPSSLLVGGPGTLDQVLATLAVEIPDLRQRVGVPDQVVFGGQGFSLTKARLQAREAWDKVREAVTFMARGVKLLGSDVGNAGRLFGKAAMGGTLKPREVSAMRRTFRDILTFIPFTIILIIPLSPLGHVLVFGFIQQYFPQLYPSCFTVKRQEVMVRYEELERQLMDARSQAEAAEEAAELARAAAAVARLTAPESTPCVVDGDVAASGPAEGPGPGDAVVRIGGTTVALSGAGRRGTTSKAVALSLSSADEADSAAAAQTAQVRELEQRVAAVYDDVTLGDDSDASPQAGGSGKPTNPVSKRLMRKQDS